MNAASASTTAGRTLSIAVTLCVAGVFALVAPVAAERTYREHKQPITLPHRSVELICASPIVARTPPFFVIFATGDWGLHGSSKATYRHMAETGQYVVAFSSKEALKPNKRSGLPITFTDISDDVGALIREGRRALGLAETTPAVVTGISRGAIFVVLASAQPSLQSSIAGGVAIGLTRESDYSKAPDAAVRPAEVQLDRHGKVMTYPLIALLRSIPLAIIQSTRDAYVPAAESRQLLGPDTPTRRLYQVDARDHSFRGGQDKMLSDLDDALKWIAAARPSSAK